MRIQLEWEEITKNDNCVALIELFKRSPDVENVLALKIKVTYYNIKFSIGMFIRYVR